MIEKLNIHSVCGVEGVIMRWDMGVSFYLVGFSSWMVIKAGKFKYGGGEETYKILNNMLGSELFFNLVRKVQESGQFSKILEKQQSRYQLQAFKLYGIDCKAIKRIYETL